MAFTGTATVKQISDRQVRITGLSLGAGASGTIGLSGSTGSPGVTLPAAFKVGVYDYGTANVPLQDAIRLSYNYVDSSGVPFVLTVAKSGTTIADFLITVANGGSASSGIEFYVFFHD